MIQWLPSQAKELLVATLLHLGSGTARMVSLKRLVRGKIYECMKMYEVPTVDAVVDMLRNLTAVKNYVVHIF